MDRTTFICMPRPAIQMVRMLLTVMLFIKVSSVVVKLDPWDPRNSSTLCRNGDVIAGQDSVTLYGTVDATSGANRIFYFSKKRVTDAFFITDCTFDASLDGCHRNLNKTCYCESSNGDIYNIVYNRTADTIDSGASLRLVFGSDRSNDTALPSVIESEVATVAINGVVELLTKENVQNYDLKSGMAYNFEICVQNLINASVYIGENDPPGPWVSPAANNCATFTFDTLSTKNLLYFAYHEGQGCQRTVSIPYTVPGPAPVDPCSTGCIIGIVVGCVVVVVVIIVVIVVCVKKKSRAKSQNKENGNTGMAVEVIEVTIIISVDASRKQLVEKVKEKLSKDDQNTLTEPLEFTYKGEKMDHENWRLKEHFPKYKGDLVLIVIVHLDRSSLCEIKEVKEKASSGGSGSGGNNAVRDSRM